MLLQWSSDKTHWGDIMAMESGSSYEFFLRQIFDATTEVAVWAFDRNGSILFANETASQRGGRTAEELLGKSAALFIPPELFEVRLARIRQVIDTGTPLQFEDLREGVYYHHTLYPLRDGDHQGRVTSAACYSRDITAQKQTQEALRENESKLRVTLDSAELGTFDLDVASGAVAWDRRSCEIFGSSLELAPRIGLCQELVVPQDWQRVQEALTEAFDPTGDGRYQAEFRVRHPEGKTVWVLCKGRVHFDGEGEGRKPVRMRGVNFDISERKLAEESLRQSRKSAEEKLRQANDELEQRVAERTAALTSTVDLLKEEIAERERAEQTAHRMNRLYAVISQTNQAITRAQTPEALFADVCRIAIAHGGMRLSWVGLVQEREELSCAASAGAVAYLQGIRVTANQEPEGTGPLGTSIREKRVCISNDFQNEANTKPWHARATMYGLRAAASVPLFREGRVIGALILYAAEKDFFDPQHVDLIRQIGADLSFALENMEREARRKQAEQALQEEIEKKLRAVEELRQKERLLVQQNRLAAMGEMISNIAHQWRQPLNVLGLILQQLQLRHEMKSLSEEEFRHCTVRGFETIKHLSQTIDDFRNFFRPEKEKVRFKVADVVRKSLTLLHGTLEKQQIVVELRLEDQVHTTGYPNEYSQVLLNILQNARDAFAAKRHEASRKHLQVHVYCTEGKAVLAVSDNAGGISQEIIGKVFDPYFTTKGPDKGTGLGLFMSKTIIEHMGGTLSVRNAGEGAEFLIETEAVREAGTVASGASRSLQEAELPRKEPNLTFLVAEDDCAAIPLLKELLGARGIAFEWAQNGVEAVEMWEKREYDLILMDIQMPGMDGISATRTIREKERARGRYVPIVAMTAGCFPEDRERGRAAGMDAYLQKPLDLERDMRVIRELLAL